MVLVLQYEYKPTVEQPKKKKKKKEKHSDNEDDSQPAAPEIMEGDEQLQ